VWLEAGLELKVRLHGWVVVMVVHSCGVCALVSHLLLARALLPPISPPACFCLGGLLGGLCAVVSALLLPPACAIHCPGGAAGCSPAGWRRGGAGAAPHQGAATGQTDRRGHGQTHPRHSTQHEGEANPCPSPAYQTPLLFRLLRTNVPISLACNVCRYACAQICFVPSAYTEVTPAFLQCHFHTAAHHASQHNSHPHGWPVRFHHDFPPFPISTAPAFLPHSTPPHPHTPHTSHTQVSPQTANRMVDGARAVLNQLLADVYIFTDAMSGRDSGASPGYGITLVAETTSGCLLSAQAAAAQVGGHREGWIAVQVCLPAISINDCQAGLATACLLTAPPVILWFMNAHPIQTYIPPTHIP
jgi:hypothetical protein